MLSSTQAGAVVNALLLFHRQHNANAVEQHTTTVNFVVKLESDSQAITAANAAISKGRLPQHESEECFIPGND